MSSAQTIQTINAKAAEAVALQESGDYDGALAKLRSVKALLITLPNLNKGDGAIQWDRQSIDALIEDLQKERRRAAGLRRGIRSTRVIYTGESEED